MFNFVHPQPYSAQLNSSRRACPKTRRVALKRIDAALFESQDGVDVEHMCDVVQRCWSQIGDRLKLDCGVDFFEQKFARDQSRLLGGRGVVLPKLIKDLPITTNQGRVLGGGRELGAGGNRGVGARLDDCSMPDGGYAFYFSSTFSAAVYRAAVVRTYQAVIANSRGHED